MGRLGAWGQSRGVVTCNRKQTDTPKLSSLWGGGGEGGGIGRVRNLWGNFSVEKEGAAGIW